MEIQRHAPVSQQIENILLDRIQKGNYSADNAFPSEADLCREFNVSRATVRTALAALTAKGLLVRRPGKGTYLVDPPLLDSGLEQLESVLQIARRQGITPEIGSLSVKVIQSDSNVSSKLGCEDADPITCISRTILVGQKVVSLHKDFVPTRFLSPADIENHFDGSVLDLLQSRHTSVLKEAMTEITSINANQELVSHLRVSLNTALILLKETVYDEGGEIVSYSENYFIPDRINLHVVRKQNINPLKGA